MKNDNNFKLFKCSPYPIVYLDWEKGKIKKVNTAFKELSLVKKDKLKTLDFFDFFLINKKDIKNNKHLISKIKNKTHTRYYKLYFTFIEEKELIVYLEDITKEKELNIIYEDNKKLLEYIAIEKSLKKTLKKIVTYAEKRNGEIKCSILLLDKEKKHLSKSIAPSLPKFYNEAIEGIEIGEKVGSCGSAAFKKKRVIVEDINSHENWQKYLELTKKANLSSCWSEPILSSNNEILGTFAIYNEIPKTPNSFDIKLINAYAKLASISIEKHLHINEIKQSKKELEKLFENSLIALLYMSKDRVFLRANLTAAKVFGFDTKEQMKGLSTRALHLNEKNYNEFGEKYLEVIKEGECFTSEYPLKKRDGSIIWCELSCKALDESIPADLNKGILWSIKDISLRKEYEEKLRNSELLNKNIISSLPQLVWLKDKKGVYLACNKEFEKFFGAKEQEIIGKTDYDFVEKELADFFRKHDQKAMDSNTLNKNEELLEYKETKEKHLLETSKKAIKDKDGKIIGVLGIGYDITQRKQKEKELKNLNKIAQELSSSQKVLLSLFDKGDSVLFNWRNDSFWSVEYVSKSAEKLLSYSKDDFLEKRISYIDCIYEEDKKRVQKEISNALKYDLDYFKHEPYRIITKEKEIKWILDYTVTKKNEKGDITNFIGYITDISNQIKNQEIMYQQSKIASMGEMLGNISHQWRQPLSAISTLATGAKLKKELDVLTDDDFGILMDSINNQAQYLSKTIDDFRNFFSTNTKSKIKVNLKLSLETILSLVNDSLKSNNIRTIINSEDFIIKCNENIFIQAVLNIFNNARDALKEKNEIKEKLIFVDLRKEKNSYILIIKDNAKGIDEKIIHKIFEPYFTTKHQSQGTGIGLYMTNQIITKHFNGEILVSNEEFEYENKKHFGACFKIIIPI